MEIKEYQKIGNLYHFDEKRKEYTENFEDTIVNYLRELPWICTEKIDGTNTRIVWDGYGFSVLGRTNKSIVTPEVMEIFSKKFIANKDMETVFEQTFGEKQVILFVEMHGGKIQRGAYDCDTQMVGFDIMVNGTYLNRIAAKQLFNIWGIEYVPVMLMNNLEEAIVFVKTHKESILHPKCDIEGLVCTPMQEIYNKKGERVIIKIKKGVLKRLKNENTEISR